MSRGGVLKRWGAASGIALALVANTARAQDNEPPVPPGLCDFGGKSGRNLDRDGLISWRDEGKTFVIDEYKFSSEFTLLQALIDLSGQFSLNGNPQIHIVIRDFRAARPSITFNNTPVPHESADRLAHMARQIEGICFGGG